MSRVPRQVVFEECGIPGGTQMTLLPFAVIAMVVYVTGYPLVVLYCLWRHREEMREDQLLRAMSLGTTRLTNPHGTVVCLYEQRIFQCDTETVVVVIACPPQRTVSGSGTTSCTTTSSLTSSSGSPSCCCGSSASRSRA